MTIYKIAEKTPELNQYCFIKCRDQWHFCIFQGIEKWGFFCNPTRLNLQTIEEWQPAFLRLGSPTVDYVRKKVSYDFLDVQNEEGESYWPSFINSVGDLDLNDDNCNRIGSDIEKRGPDL